MPSELNLGASIEQLHLGNQLMEQGKLSEAIAHYQSATVLDTNCFEAYHQWGRSLEQLGQARQAIACYQKAIALNAAFPWSHYSLGGVLAAQGQTQPAIYHYRKALELDPNISWAYCDLGTALAKQGQLHEAMACYQKAIQLNPDYAWSYHNLADALVAQKRLDEAIAYYYKAVALSPDSYETYYSLGTVLASQGKITAAIACYQQAILIKPDFEPPFVELQYLATDSTNLEEITAFYRKIVQVSPDSFLAWGNLGDALTQQGQISEAIACYQTCCYKQTIATHPQLAQLLWQPKKSTSPDFLIIGAAKSGTSSLYVYLSQHPQILCGHKKEIEFFSWNYERGIDWYLAQFPAITDRPEFLTGEASPGYMGFPGTDYRILASFPQVKLIVLLRNPVDRAISQYHHWVRLGHEQRSLEEAIAAEIQLLHQTPEDALSFGSSELLCLSGGLYFYQLQRWMRLFPPEQFLILRSEDFFGNTATVMQQVFSFLGLPDHALDRYAKLNSGSYPASHADVRKILADCYRPYNQKLEDYLGRSFNWD